jgi:hypothetical protein
MLIRTLTVAAMLALAAAPVAAATPQKAPVTAPETMTIADLMYATGLDQVFSQFGATIAASPTEQGLPAPAEFIRAWQVTANEVFEPDALQGELTRLLDEKFSAGELAEFATFFRSTFGRTITEFERVVVVMSPADQLAARDEGAALLEDIAEGSPRDKQLDEIMTLVSADITRTMVGESVRGMLIGMSAARQSGDIEVPWEEIEAELARIMPSMDAEIEATQRAMMAYAYRVLSQDELEQYLQFLRTDAAQKLYAVASYAVGSVVTASMHRFGTALAHRMAQVNV